ncbi:hypothetical protein BsWGS_28430 [Bradybaena similaris]
MDATRTLLMLYCFILSTDTLLAADDQCGGVAEEGSDFSLTCRFPGTIQGLVWQLQVQGQFETLSTCSQSGTCTNSTSAHGTFIASIANSSGSAGESGFVGRLRIVSVNRTRNTFKCLQLDQTRSQTCNLQVYVKTQKPTCQDPTFVTIGSETHLQVTCASERVYPAGNCNFTSKGLPSNIIPVITFHNTASSSSPGDYKTQCNWSIPLLGVEPTLVQVKVEVYPELRKWVEVASAYSQWTQPLVLDFPRVRLGSSCEFGSSVRNGYILQGTVATCRCELSSEGSPPGFAQWFTNNGSKLGVRDADGTAVLTLDRIVQGLSYVCRPQSPLNQSVAPVQGVSFHPEYAGGPTQVQIDMSDSFPLCPSESLKYYITCKVPHDQVVPRPLFTISVDNNTVISNQTGQFNEVTKHFQLTHTFRPDSGGILRIHCKAANEIFPERFTMLERPLIINYPPRQPPRLKTQYDQPQEGSREAYVTDRSAVALTCLVEGGYPPVNNVVIVCGGNTTTTSGPMAMASVRIPDGAQALVCSCSASHITGCYHLRTEIVLTLRQPGSVPENANYSVALGLGIGLGSVIVIVIILFIVFIIVHKKKDTITKDKRCQRFDYSQPGMATDPSYQYASVVQGAPSPPPRLRLDIPGENDYDLIGLETDTPQESTLCKHFTQNESSTDLQKVTESDLANGYIQPI